MDINLILTIFIGILFIFMFAMLRENKNVTFDKKIKETKEQDFKELEKIKTDKPNTTFLGVSSNKKKVRVNNDSAHFFVAGTTGSGKTVCLSNFVQSAVTNNSPLVILDGKGDTDLVNKSRSACCTCILATQSIMDLKAVSENYHEQIIENCNNYIILRQNSAKGAEFWADTLGTKKTMQHTFQVEEGQATGKGSISQQQEYLYHPNVIKNLTTGEAIYINKDNGFHTQLAVNKPF